MPAQGRAQGVGQLYWFPKGLCPKSVSVMSGQSAAGVSTRSTRCGTSRLAALSRPCSSDLGGPVLVAGSSEWVYGSAVGRCLTFRRVD